MTRCSKCNETLTIGDWPYCPHGPAQSIAIHGDEIDYVDHNLGKYPVHIRSKAERRRLMKERGLVEAVRHVPHPAGSHMNQTVDWGNCIDPVTAQNKRELMERAFGQKVEPSDDGETLRKDIHDMTPAELEIYRHA